MAVKARSDPRWTHHDPTCCSALDDQGGFKAQGQEERQVIVFNLKGCMVGAILMLKLETYSSNTTAQLYIGMERLHRSRIAFETKKSIHAK